MFFLGNGGFQFQFSLEPIQWVQWHLQNHLPQLFDFLVGAAMRHVESSIRSSRSPACGAIRSHRAIVWCDLAKGTKGTGDMFWHWLYVLHYLLHLWYRNSYPNHQWYTFMDKNIPPGSVSMSNIYIYIYKNVIYNRPTLWLSLTVEIREKKQRARLLWKQGKRRKNVFWIATGCLASLHTNGWWCF